MKKPVLVIIDANAILRRCFYAMDRLTYKGQTTHAIKGLVNKIEECQYKFSATHLTVCFDGKSPNHRHKIYPDYKKNRRIDPKDKKKVKEEAEFLSQALLAHKLIPLLGYHIAHRDGVEADDWIKTWTDKFAGLGARVVIISGDKDFYSLLRPGVRMWDGKSSEIWDHKYVKSKFGIKPPRFRDYHALVGDGVDYIPGVVGVGPTTALELVKKYDSLGAMWKARKSMTGLAKTAFSNTTKAHIKLMRDLVTLVDIDTEDRPRHLRVPPSKKNLPEKKLERLRRFNKANLGFWKNSI